MLLLLTSRSACPSARVAMFTTKNASGQAQVAHLAEKHAVRKQCSTKLKPVTERYSCLMRDHLGVKSEFIMYTRAMCHSP